MGDNGERTDTIAANPHTKQTYAFLEQLAMSTIISKGNADMEPVRKMNERIRHLAKNNARREDNRNN